MNEKILEALDFVDERFVAEVEDMTPSWVCRLRRMAVLAAAAALLFTVTAAAAGWFDLSAWFSRRWQEQTGQPMTGAQTALLADLSQELDMTAVDGGLRVTAEEVTVGRNDVAVLFRVQMEEGALEPCMWYGFDPVWSMVDMEPGDKASGHGFDFVGFDEAEGAAYIVFEYTGISDQALSAGRHLHLELKNLIFCTDNVSPTQTAVEGSWVFDIALEAREAILSLGDFDVEVLDADGVIRSVRLRDLELSGTGLHYWRDTQREEGLPLPWLLLSDGTELRAASGGSYRTEEERFLESWSWTAPVELESICGIRIGQTKILLPISE